MKHKIIIAYESESSQTTRLTVSDYAALFQNIPDSEVAKFFQNIVADAHIFGTEWRREVISEQFNHYAKLGSKL